MREFACYAFYVAACLVIVLHYTGWLRERALDWAVYAVAVSVFPVVWFPA